MTDHGVIAHYNFSWPLSMDNGPLNGTPLSESAAILQKAKNLGYIEGETTEDTETLEKFRADFYGKQLEQLKIELDRNILMFGLTELSVRDNTKKSGHAVFTSSTLTGTGMSTNMIDENNYEEFGIGKMLKNLGNQITDRSVVGSVSDKQYDIMYDNVVHASFGFGEGIGLIIRKDLVDSYFTWKSKSRGFFDKITNAVPENENDIHFWSSDCGYSTDQLNLYKTVKGDLDLGRPFIMTAGMKGNILRIFVNFHGVNILNLYTDADADAGKRQLKVLLKDKNDTAYKKAIEAVKLSIVKLIDSGLEKVQNNIISKDITQCQLFLTCDSNDAKNDLFKAIIKDGIQLTKLPFNYNHIKFKYNEDEHVYTCCANADSLNEGKQKLFTKLEDNLPEKDFNGVGKLTGRNFSNGIITSQTDNDEYPADFINPLHYGYTGDRALFGTTFANPSNEMLQMLREDDKFIFENNGDKVPLSDHQYVTTTIPMRLIDLATTMNKLKPSPIGGRRRKSRRTRKSKKAKNPRKSKKPRKSKRRSRR